MEEKSSSSSDSTQDRIEPGSSVFELIEFTMERTLNSGVKMRGIYGVNVAKVREVLRMPTINPLASRLPQVAGIFELRGHAIPVINLAKALGDDHAPLTPSQQIIVTEFSQKRAGFVVSATRRIRRIRWDRVMPPSGESEACITGMTLVENNEFLFILDLERILLDIEGRIIGPAAAPLMVPQQQSGQSATKGMSSGDSKRPTILFADDSKLIVTTVKSALVNSGYRVLDASDGAMAYEILLANLANPRDGKIEAVVTDVEMPRMDGLTLCKTIREHEKLRHLPVILHTSLSGQSNQEAGIKVGANGYVVKNNIRDLLELLAELTGSAALKAG